MSKTTRNIKIFLSSPSDVSAEREKVFQAAERLNKNMSSSLGRRLEIVGW